MLRKSILTIIILMSGCLLSACQSTTGLAPVTNGWQTARNVQGAYDVQPGDTLYSIAWRFGSDYRKLAKINAISPPYELEVGQHIYLVSPTAKAKIQYGATKSLVANTAPSTATAPVVVETTLQARTRKTTVTSNRTQPAKKVTRAPRKARTTHQRSSRVLPQYNGARVRHWRWPAAGRVIKNFSKLNKGIDIAGREGEPVRATAAGQVVYSGSGLRGYGKLLIIKHNNNYLSAYAHNKKLLVHEGTKVRSGQKIALMGNTGSKQTMLHFEIRRSGRPINPLKLLASR